MLRNATRRGPPRDATAPPVGSADASLAGLVTAQPADLVTKGQRRKWAVSFEFAGGVTSRSWW